MIIDTHLHFYDMPEPAQHDPGDHLSVSQVLHDAAEIGVDRVVQVTPMAVGYDNSYSFAMARKHPGKIVGVIARLDPLAPDIEDTLCELLEQPEMLALRLTLIEKHNVTWLADRTLDKFFALAGRLDLPLELFAPFRVAEMHETVRRFPQVRWLIDHMGLRYYAGKDNQQVFRQWPELMQLAGEPNAWIKCAYFPEAAKDLESYPFPRARDHLKQLVDAAGTQRLVWGSNYPNVRRACTYRQALDLIRKDSDFLTPAQRDALLGGNFLTYVKREPSRRGAAGSPPAG
jgi:predicted TIM-barrel fold metal-dependent hydrolase